ncbi:hypothetical protein KGD82_16480 [Nocardiopsis eucommiae]|uniref:Uncharacterized protein n=1 Tax=Nocardiopsis eucommiae TaxID=2831970 RepID=A0A975L707_9ACTN|nr:hypothetical protein KGD82_16480 [Nocardiopsis eucommiae]
MNNSYWVTYHESPEISIAAVETTIANLHSRGICPPGLRAKAFRLIQKRLGAFHWVPAGAYIRGRRGLEALAPERIEEIFIGACEDIVLRRDR